jgi:hypothetical protein
MIGLWTGAATLAPGTTTTDILVDRTNSNAAITNAEQINGTKFEYDADDNVIYTIIVRPDTTSTVSIDIYFDEILQASVAASAYTVDQISELHFAAGQDRVLILHESIQPRKLVRGTDHTSWTLSTQDFSTKPVFDFSVIGLATSYRVAGFTFTPAATTGTGINLTASGAVYDDNHIGGIFIGRGGVARITAVTSTTVAVMTILVDFVSTAAINGTDSSLSEVMWTSGGGTIAGADRGWPARALFFLNRLIMGRSSALKNVSAASVAGVYDNFDDSDADATTGFSFSLNSKGNQTLQDIVGDDALLFFGGSRLFATNPLVEGPITPANFFAPPQGSDGASDIPVVTLDNQIYHVQKNKNEILQVAYSTPNAKYMSTPATEFSSHLIETISSNGVWLPDNVTAKLYLATQENGSMIMLNSLLEQGVQAWSLRTTRGKIKRVISLGNEAHIIAERQINIGASYSSGIDYGFTSDSTFKAFYGITGPLRGTDATIFSAQNEYIVVGSKTEFLGIRVGLGTVSSHDITATFEYLDVDGAWQTFTPTADGTTGFTVAGDITWTAALVSTWGARNLNSVLGKYWIRIRRTAVTVTTPPVPTLITATTNTDFSTAYTTNTGFTTFTDVTDDFANTNVAMFEEVSDYLALGNDIPWTGMDINLETNSSTDIAATFEYLDVNGNWNVFAPTDGTTGFTGDGAITWTFTDVSDWGPGTVNKIEDKYWIRIRRTEETITTTPVEADLTINTASRLFLEKLDFSKYMDATQNTTSSATGAVTGLTNLAGQQVYAIADGATTGPYFVDSTGAVNIVEEYSSVDIGVQYSPLLRPMPVFTPTQEGDNLYKERKIMSVFVDYLDSLYLQCNGKDIPMIDIGDYTLGQPMPPQTNFFEVTPQTGWEPRENIDITQDAPGPMTIIGVGYHTEIT